MQYDAFICHASEDKDAFVRPLAERLREQHVEVWYDEFSLKVGDSLRRSIDHGLLHSRFGIVVISPSFFDKQWSQWELDGLVSLQTDRADPVVLPVWHGVQRDDVLGYSPPLADKLAVSSDAGIEEVVRRLVAVIHPEGSTLVIARDHLLNWGCSPPVVTDDWWLDVAAAAESNDLEGDWQEPMGWGRWGFPLPPIAKSPYDRGWRLAWAAMQMTWQQEADGRPITQVTRPELVHEFIASQPGLAEACSDHLRYLTTYAPQLVITGFGGTYESAIEKEYQRSITVHESRRAARDRTGTGLTVDGDHPRCDEGFALRAPPFGGYRPAGIACGFVQGFHIANGPPVQYYCTIDYLAWLLSDESTWLPDPTRDFLTRGMAGWGVWPWFDERRAVEDLGFKAERYTGKFADALERARTRATFKPGVDARRDLQHRLAFSASLMHLPEDGATLASRLMDTEVLDVYFARRIDRRRRR